MQNSLTYAYFGYFAYDTLSLLWVYTRGDQQPEQEPELDPEFSYFGRSLSRSRSGKVFKKPDQEPEPELCYGIFSFKLSFAYVRKIDNKNQLHHFHHYSVFTSQPQLFIWICDPMGSFRPQWCGNCLIDFDSKLFQTILAHSANIIT